jgi:maternal-effect protein exuperantia
MDFLSWLEKINDEKDGIILVYHEQAKLAPYMLIESMKRFNLFERFDKIVKAFVNGYELSEDEQKGKGLKYLTLAQNYKVHADCLKMDTKESDEFEGNAAVRAKLSYEICKLMSYEGEMKELDEKETYNAMNKFVSNKARPIDRELDELVEMEESISRQTDMRDIFITYFSTSRFHR